MSSRELPLLLGTTWDSQRFPLEVGKEKGSAGLVFQLSIDTSLLCGLGLLSNQVESPTPGV